MNPLRAAHERTWAFLDEYGNVDVDTSKSGVTTHFVVASVVAPDSGVDALRRAMDVIRQAHCGSGELKSKKLAKNPDRYRKVLEEIAALPFSFSALAVDKREVSPDTGLIYGQPFYKWFQKKVYQQLFSTYPSVSVVADEYGTDDYMRGFGEYIAERLAKQLELFSPANTAITFVDGKSEPLVQLADVIAGVIGRALDDSRSPNPFLDLLPIIRPRSFGIQEWPTRRVRWAPDAGTAGANADAQADAVVAALSLQRAEAFLARDIELPDQEDVAQIRVLKRLLFEATLGDPRRFVSTGELLDDLAAFAGVRPTDRWLRSNVIAPLREADVIVSSSPKGYIVPTCVDDMRPFVDHADRVIGPMLRRLKLARDAVRRASHGKIDLLEAEQYQLLARAVDALDFFERHAAEPEAT